MYRRNVSACFRFGTALPAPPGPRASGLWTVVVARAACNQRLVDACYLRAFASLTASPVRDAG
jgi:hypothetical protein